jgi:hypothetical protein
MPLKPGGEHTLAVFERAYAVSAIAGGWTPRAARMLRAFWMNE